MRNYLRCILLVCPIVLSFSVAAQTSSGPSLTYAQVVNKLQRASQTYIPTYDGNLIVAYFYADGVGTNIKNWNLQVTKYLTTGKVAYSQVTSLPKTISGNVALAEATDRSIIVSGNGTTYAYAPGNAAKLKWSKPYRGSVLYPTPDGGVLLTNPNPGDPDRGTNTKLSAKGDMEWQLNSNFLIATTDGGYVRYDGNGGLTKLDGQRQQQWQINETAAFAQAIADGVVYRTNDKLVKVNNAGKEAWRYTVPGDASLRPFKVVETTDGGIVFSSDQTYKLTNAGTLQWQSQVRDVLQTTTDGGLLCLLRDRPASEFTTTGYTLTKLTGTGTITWQRYISGQLDGDLNGMRGVASAFQSRHGDYWFISETSAVPTNQYTSNLVVSRFCRDFLKLYATAGLTTGVIPIRKDTSLTVCRADSVGLGFTDENTVPGLLFQWKLNGAPVSSTPKGLLRAKEPGTYQVQAADSSCGVSDTSPTLTIAQNPSPRVTMTGSNFFCAGGSVTLAATGSNGTGAYYYQWSKNNKPISTSATISVSEAGQYSVTASDDGGCASSPVVLLVTENPAISVSIAGADYFCPSSSSRLSAVVSGGTPGFRYQWKRNGEMLAARNVNFAADRAGAYSVEVTDSRNCPVESKTLVVTEVPTLTLTAGTSTTLTGTETYTLTNVTTASGGSAPYSYQWTTSQAAVPGNGSTAAQPTFGPFTTNTDIQLVVTDTKGCSQTAVSKVTYKPCTMEAAINGLNYFCTGTTTSLTLAISNGNAPFKAIWQGSELLLNTNTYTQVFQKPATLTADITDSKGCTAKAKDVVVTEVARPTATITGQTVFCKGSSTQLSAVVGGGKAPYTYEWRQVGTATNPASTSATTNGTYSATAAGAFVVTVKDANGCDNVSPSVTLTHKAADLDAKITPSGPTEVYLPASVTLTANTGTGLTYQWQKEGQDIVGAVSPAISTTQTGSYVVKVSLDGCTLASAAQEVKVLAPLALEPTAPPVQFTVFPNPVENTCQVTIQTDKASPVTVSVYNLLGQRVQTIQINTRSTAHEVMLNLSAQSVGTYVIDVKAGAATARKRLVKIAGR
ncbi:hypothetical protein BN8_06661 [Fibrisoma limi BUZ 3]|uniref:Secretion system C-terminal sorting domain-containing protein n=1 Tax=Fibrisoma limi BUZ 3 TaxID=1185876 RepID=I2GTM4_9BACT|nr:T9SS type A sorting domain-containing protein [Fibrisoma limi]CCH57253.1 hypothetical protein BN8_06661 [Fibrisoma limi BUZ 3]